MNKLAVLLSAFFLAALVGSNADNPKDKFETLRKDAEQGNAPAQFNLGWMHEYGEGVPKDSAKAVEWYRKAAEQGHAKAQSNLGVMYAKGDGVPKDSAKAVQWWRKAAEQGYAAAQNGLGVMYAKGEGVPKDTVSAYMYLNLASSTESNAAKARDELAKEMTPDQISEAQRLSREWKPTTQPK
jgi:hypothetical protein